MAVHRAAARLLADDDACRAAAAIARLAGAGDAPALAAAGRRYRRRAEAWPATLAVFGLDDDARVTPYLTAGRVHPVLVTLLAWIPLLEPLPPADALFLASTYRRDASPVQRRTSVGRMFLPLERLLPRPMPARWPRLGDADDLGAWTDASRLARRFRRDGREADARQVLAMAGDASRSVPAGRTWLATATIW